MSAKPHLRRVWMPNAALAVPDPSEAPAIGAALVKVLCFDELLMRTSTIGRDHHHGRFAVSTSLAPLRSPFAGGLAEALIDSTFSHLDRAAMVDAGIPVEPSEVAELGALLISLLERAESYELPASRWPASKYHSAIDGRDVILVEFDHRPRAEARLRYRVLFAPGTNDSVRADTALAALRLGLAELSNRAAGLGLHKLDPDRPQP
jgi:hypothetical protein